MGASQTLEEQVEFVLRGRAEEIEDPEARAIAERAVAGARSDEAWAESRRRAGVEAEGNRADEAGDEKWAAARRRAGVEA